MFHAKKDAGDRLHPYCKACQKRENQWRQKARYVATQRLRSEYPDEWDRYYRDALEEIAKGSGVAADT